MKLKNRKTGEIVEFFGEFHREDNKPTFVSDDICTLKKLNDEWEDYEEEPKEYWYINCDGEIFPKEYQWFNQQQDNIGNRFETKEQAELAVRKLKAWKRLKDAGLKFSGCYSTIERFIGIERFAETPELDKDFDLLFEGEKNE